MFRRRNEIEVVPENEYTDFSDRVSEDAYATKETYIVAALVPTTALLGLMAFSKPNPIVESPQIIPVSSTPISSTLPIDITSSPDMIQTGYIADKSLEALANVLDPIIQLMVTLSFPIASVMVVGSCFFLMFGNSDRAMSGIMKASLGFCLIQISPLLLDILRTLGESVAPQ